MLCIVLSASIFMLSACDKDKGGNNGEGGSYTKEDVEKLVEQIFTYVFKTDNSVVTFFAYIGGTDDDDPGCVWRIGFGACYISKYKSVDYANSAFEALKQDFDENAEHDGGTKLEGLYFEQHGEYVVWGQNKSFLEAVKNTEPDLSGIPTILKTEYKNCIDDILNNDLTGYVVDTNFDDCGGLFSITYYMYNEEKTKEIVWLADENNAEAKNRYEEIKKSPDTQDVGDNVLITIQSK